VGNIITIFFHKKSWIVDFFFFLEILHFWEGLNDFFSYCGNAMGNDFFINIKNANRC
jgi:hypothetical protein